MPTPAAVGALAAAAAISVLAGYQSRRPMVVEPSRWTARQALDGFFDPEGGFVWSGGRAAVTFPEPGAGWTARIELSVSAWRPRGQAPPAVLAQSRDAQVLARLGPSVEVLVLPARTAGFWTSDLSVRLQAETFQPSSSDPRDLGVRLHGARLLFQEQQWPLAPPPLRPLVATMAFTLCTWLLLRRRLPERRALAGATAAAVLWGAAFAVSRATAALLVMPASVLVAAVAALFWAAPGLPRAAGRMAAAWGRVAREGAAALRPAPVALIAVWAALAAAAATLARPRVEIDLGSGRESALAYGLGPYERRWDESCRQAVSGGRLDLRDFGSGSWRVTLVAAAEGGSRPMRVARLGEAVVAGTLGPSWGALATQARAPLGWRSGLALDFQPPRRSAVYVDRVLLERGRALPSPWLVLALSGSGLAVAFALAAAGLRPRLALVGGAAWIGLGALGLALDPVLAVPFARWTLLIAVCAAVFAVAVTGAFRHLAAHGPLAPGTAARVAAVLGFLAWLTATALPTYRGGHFVFHSRIAEEIWKGRFLTYYLPYPGSMLSAQAQWGNIVVPHPCLYHALAAPLAALPLPWFHFAEKVFLAALLASLVLAAHLLAAAAAGPAAGAYAAVVAASMPPAFQLLGLGHLMTVLGCAAMAWSLTALVLAWEKLDARRHWWALVGLLTFAFLSYFAAVVFLAFVVAVIGALTWRPSPRSARALVTATATAAVIAFALYYVHWAVPFLAQSLPAIFAGAGSSGEAAAALGIRLAALPRKLQYTFGSGLLPAAGLAGVALLPRRRERVIVGAWAAVLVVFSAADLFFNFLLKHHYFTMVPVAVGCGVLLARLRAAAGRPAAAVAVALVLLLAARGAADVALGRIP